MIRVFAPGFLGGTATDSSVWFGERVKGAKSICVPFTGAAKHVSGMAQEGCHIDCWDTQVISRAFIEGVIAATQYVSHLEETPRYYKGVAYDERFLKAIDDHCAGFLDWVGHFGSMLDKAAVASATGKQTYRGRMDTWNSDIDMYWKSFVRMRNYMREFVGFYPGTFAAYEGNFFEASEWRDKEYDVLQVDPPKIVGTTDIYSSRFGALNRALGGTVTMDRWTWRDYVGRIRAVLEVKSKVIAFQYCSDVRPDLNTIERLLSEYGKIVDRAIFPHGQKNDYTLLVERS